MDAAATARRREIFRRAGIQAYRLGARAVRFLPPPRVFVASQPKTGSHLLNALLQGLPRMMFSGVHYSQDDFVFIPTPHAVEMARGRRDTDWDRLQKGLSRIRNGQFMTAHWPYKQRLNEILDDLRFKKIFLMRDPRDMVVSLTFFVTRTPTNYLYDRYNNQFKTTEERLMASIVGFPPDEHGRGQQPLGRRLGAFAAWASANGVLVVKFESIVGEKGGGSAAEQREAIGEISSHLDRRLNADQVTSLAEHIWSTKSLTFRKGGIGDWRNHFTEEHKAAFKEQTGQLLIDLGYESGLDW